MSEFPFERGLFATLAAALIVPELTTFLIFAFLTVRLSGLLAYHVWVFLHAFANGRLATLQVTAQPALRVVSVERSHFPAE
jgi:hypothetical protein